MFTQCVRLVGITNFRKIMKIAHFTKSYFSMKIENVEKWVYHYFDENDVIIIRKTLRRLLTYIKIYGGKHYVYVFYASSLHYVFSKND